MESWNTDGSEFLRDHHGTTDDPGDRPASKQAGLNPDDLSELVLCAGRAVERRGWPTAHLSRVESLTAEGPSGDPLVVVETAAALNAAIAQHLAALAGAGREVMLVTDTDPPSEASSWLPSGAVVTLDTFAAATSAEQHESSASPPDIGSAEDALTGAVDGQFTESLFEGIEEQIENGAELSRALDDLSRALDDLSISVCTDRAWFTPMGPAWLRPGGDDPSGPRGRDNPYQDLHELGALLSIPIRVDGIVGLGLLRPDYEYGGLAGVYLSGSSDRTPPADPDPWGRTPPQDPWTSPRYDGYHAKIVELLADPYGDEGCGPLFPLPAVVTSVRFAQEVVQTFIDGVMQTLGEILVQDGAVGLRRVDYPTSLGSAWELMVSELRDLGNG